MGYRLKYDNLIFSIKSPHHRSQQPSEPIAEYLSNGDNEDRLGAVIEDLC